MSSVKSSIGSYKYAFSVRLFHSLVAFLVVTLLIVGVFMTKYEKYSVYPLHKSFGILVLIIWPIRLFYRVKSQDPQEENFAKWEKISASCVHVSLYILSFLMPLSGYLMSSFSGKKVNFFFVDLPLVTTTNKNLASCMRNAHSIIAVFLVVSILIHIAAALKHLICDKKNILKRMF